MYTYQTVVRYEDLDAQGRVKIPAILNYLQNAAVMNAAAVGYDIDRMAELDLCWVVMCWDVKLGRRIRWNEALTVETWPYQFYGSIGKRGSAYFPRREKCWRRRILGGRCSVSRIKQWLMCRPKWRRLFRRAGKLHSHCTAPEERRR